MRFRLTPEIEARLLAGIRAGGFLHVAAEAAGMPGEVFEDWLRRGTGSNGTPRQRAFAAAVRQAQAQARLKAEIAACGDPKFWLKHGPGRETPGAAGWTNPAKPAPPRGSAAASDPFADPDFAELWDVILRALTDFPDARLAIVAAIDRLHEARSTPGTSPPAPAPSTAATSAAAPPP